MIYHYQFFFRGSDTEKLKDFATVAAQYSDTPKIDGDLLTVTYYAENLAIEDRLDCIDISQAESYGVEFSGSSECKLDLESG